MTATYIMLFMNAGGHIHKIIEPVSFNLSPYRWWYCILVDILWALLTLKLFFEEGIEVLRHWKQLGIAKGTKVYMTFSNAVDWVSILYAFAVAIFWLLHVQLLETLKQHLKKSSLDQIGSFDNEKDRTDF